MSEFNDIIRRKMVRHYIQDKPIPQQIVDKLITNGHRAPSAVILGFKNL
jgi:nitroreductase